MRLTPAGAPSPSFRSSRPGCSCDRHAACEPSSEDPPIGCERLEIEGGGNEERNYHARRQTEHTRNRQRTLPVHDDSDARPLLFAVRGDEELAELSD